MRRLPSITRALAIRIAAIFLASPLLAIPVLLLFDDEGFNPALNAKIEQQADAVAALLYTTPSGQLALPEQAIRRQPAISKLRFVVYAEHAPAPIRWPRNLHLGSWDYHDGYQTVRRTAQGPIRILFVPPAGSWRARANWILGELLDEIVPLSVLLMGLMLPLALLGVRQSLAPVRQLAKEAEKIEPGVTLIRLNDHNTPRELCPLVSAINLSLDRLDAGFSAQRQFSAKIAHELRTPITAIAAQLERIPTEEELAQLRKRLNRMARLVQQLLIVSEMSSQRIRANRQIDLVRVARDAISEEVPLAISTDVDLELEAPQRQVPIRGNAAAVATGLRNLVSNAVRYSKPGQRVVVTVMEHPPALEVADNGPGVSADRRESIFEPFWRDPASPGAGVGLAIVQEVAQLHGGKVSLRNNRETGSVFRLEFPEPDGRYSEMSREIISPASTAGLPSSKPATL